MSYQRRGSSLLSFCEWLSTSQRGYDLPLQKGPLSPSSGKFRPLSPSLSHHPARERALSVSLFREGFLSLTADTRVFYPLFRTGPKVCLDLRALRRGATSFFLSPPCLKGIFVAVPMGTVGKFLQRTRLPSCDI